MRAALDLFLREQRKPPLDQIQPGRAGRREVDVEARPRRQPALNPCGLVRAVVVQDQVDVEMRRDRRVDRIQKPETLLTAVTAMALPMTRPVATSSAAKREVVPWRR